MKEKIKEPFVSEIRNKLIRYRKGQFTEEELRQFEKEKELSKRYTAVWKI